MVVSFARMLSPLKGWQNWARRAQDWIGRRWVDFNNLNIYLTQKIQWDIRMDQSLNMKEWYLIFCNHQSWADILVLQKVFIHRIPFMKFFIKSELKWLPVLGLASWAFELPFVKRYSREFLEKHPELKGRDIELTRKACDKFKTIPVSITNFLEGTRFSRKKHGLQESPYEHLLKPRAGGIAIVMNAMQEYLRKIVNVTIAYPEARRSFWDFVSGKVTRVMVHVETIQIPDALIGDYFGDAEFREGFQNWVNDLWEKKDARLARMLNSARA